MVNCKKFKPADGASFVLPPGGDCAGCVYFSASNCGTHGGPGSREASLFSTTA